jgi:hypothetical protein
MSVGSTLVCFDVARPSIVTGINKSVSNCAAALTSDQNLAHNLISLLLCHVLACGLPISGVNQINGLGRFALLPDNITTTNDSYSHV